MSKKTKTAALIAVVGAAAVVLTVFLTDRRVSEPRAVPVILTLQSESAVVYDDIWEDGGTSSGKAEVTSAAKTTAKTATVKTTTTPAVVFPLNLNTASVEELTHLKGVGEVIAQRIYDYAREHGFSSVDELINVSGIGEKKLEDIRPHVYVD